MRATSVHQREGPALALRAPPAVGIKTQAAPHSPVVFLPRLLLAAQPDLSATGLRCSQRWDWPAPQPGWAGAGAQGPLAAASDGGAGASSRFYLASLLILLCAVWGEEPPGVACLAVAHPSP